MNKRRIISTLGPSSLKENIVRKMDESGVDIFRINLSHTEINDYENIVKMVSGWTDKPVCPDTEGAQLRVGKIIGDKDFIIAEKDSIIEIVGIDNYTGKQNQIPLSINSPEVLLKQGYLLKIDFDAVIVQIIKSGKGVVTGRVISGGKVGSNKGISCDRLLRLPAFSKKDLKIIEISKRLGQKIVFLSFCSDADEIKELRKKYDYKIEVIAKIENESGFRDLKGICIESDGVLIDRGDLSRDVPIEKIPFAQSFIIKMAKTFSVPVYVATNLMENMIEKSKPTRAEVNDIVESLESGATGLVLAAETAIGKYPVECVRIMSRIMNEYDIFSNKTNHRITTENAIDYLLTLHSDRMVEPHGGGLIQRHIETICDKELSCLYCLPVDDKIESDITQISEGTYSPLSGFMNLENIDSVLNTNKLVNGITWTLPIIFQLHKDQARALPNEGTIAIRSKKHNQIFALLKINEIQKIDDMNKVAKKWFSTDDPRHPGVFNFMNGGEYILSGNPLLIRDRSITSIDSNYELTPKQTRDIFNHNNWHDVVGFHTRNIVHRGHERIQRLALEKTNADAIYISPVTGVKKKGDFTAKAIISCYEKLIQEGTYNPYGVLIGSFNTYSRYSGPREAVFTAICRKNYGCNYFIVGRDHTGVGDYYSKDASQNIFDELDLGINILKFDTIAYCKKRKIFTDDFNNGEYSKSRVSISGTVIREALLEGTGIPEYLLSPSVSSQIYEMFADKEDLIFEN